MKKGFENISKPSEEIPVDNGQTPPGDQTLVDNGQTLSDNYTSKGFLPKDDQYHEVIQTLQEEVESNPQRYIIKECIPACKELWSKNIYTFMVSDYLNEGECWIEIALNALSNENKEVYDNLSGDDLKKFSYHEGTVNFGVTKVGEKGQSELYDLARQFKMQDVVEGFAYISMQTFLMKECGCYDETPNPDYKEEPRFNPNSSLEEFMEYEEKMRQWMTTNQHCKTLKQFNPDKLTRPAEEIASEKGMIIDGDRVYLNEFHYKKHLNYLASLSNEQNAQ